MQLKKDELESELMKCDTPCQLSDNDLETLAITIKEETQEKEEIQEEKTQEEDNTD